MRKNVLFKSLLALALVLISGSVWGETKTLIVDGAQLDNTDYSTEAKEYVIDGVSFTVGKGAKQISSTGANRFTDVAIIIGKKDAYIYNNTAIPGRITKFEIYSNQGASKKVAVGINFSSKPISSFDGNAANTYSATLETLDHVYDCSESLPSDAKYFWYQITNAYNSQIQFRITYEDEGTNPNTAIETSVIIDDAGLTNKDVFSGSDAGALSAAVYANNEQISGATVEWTSSNENVASIDNLGKVTLVAAGTTTIKASYAGIENQYLPSFKSYELTVINNDPNAVGTLTNPYTVAQAIAAIEAGTGVTGVYAKGIVSKIVTAFNAQFGNISYNISEDGSEESEQLQAYRGFDKDGEWFTSDEDVQVGDQVVIYGNLKKYNTIYEFDANNQRVSFIRSSTPSISVSPAEVELDAAEQEGSLDVTFKNIDTQNAQVNVTFVDANGRPLPAEPDWIAADFENGKVAYLVEANTGDARTAYLVVSVNNYQSNVVTIAQAKVKLAYAALPFEYDGDGTGILPDGLTAEGLGNYSSSPALKFDNTDDYLILQINEQPGKLTFDIKGNGFSGGTFTVQTSADGQTYTDLATYTELGTTQSESFANLAENVRYIKWVYTEKVTGNVALGNIKLEKYVVPEKYPIKIGASDNIELFVFDAANQNEPLQSGAEVLSGTELLISADPAQGYELESISVTDAEGTAISLKENADDGTFTFTMPASNITIVATAKEVTPVTYTNYTLATSVEPGKHYIVVGKSDTGIYAMGAQNTNNRAAVKVEAGDNGVMVPSDAEVYELVISGFDADYAIYDYAEASPGFLYAASSSQNHLKTTNKLNDNAKWAISFDAESGEASIKAQGNYTHNIIRYNSTNGLFSCYNSGQQPVYLYVKVGDNAQEVSYYKTIAHEYATLCLPFAVEVPEGVEAFIATAYSDEAVTLTKLEAGVVPAQTGVVVAASESTVAKFVGTEKTERVADNLLKGVTEKTAYAAVQGINAYALQLVGEEAKFCLVEGGSFAANTAYLELPAGQSQTIGVRFGDATMVEAVTAAGESSVIYDLTGRRVEKMTKGIYIVNGKKVMMR